MFVYLRIVRESFLQAIQQLVNNKLRAFLSLLGISIGIFCIISVLSAVDSLEKSVVSSFEKLGNDVIYVDKRPWTEDPSRNYWKYVKWPEPDYGDFKVLQEKLGDEAISSFALFMPGKTMKYRNNSINGLFMVGATYDYDKIFNLSFESGRYFTPFEYEVGANKLILGYEVKASLFGDLDATGRSIKMLGRKFQVVGVLEEEGESLINVFPLDRAVIMNFNTARKLYNTNSRSFGQSLTVKPMADKKLDMEYFRGELTGALRAGRKLKPREDNNFVLNELSMIADALQGFFGVLNTAGFVIGIFAILVGMFSVANIMFVSVKERTNIIGIKKALGAKRFMILLEFLIESVVLCIIGGLLGLVLVALTFVILDRSMTFEFFLPIQNILMGIILSVLIGVLSGLIPAMQASKMDPVEAMRS
jgi:putative ABC transport system permease protein